MCDSKCIANSSICDGEKDCLDGKDEENCPVPNSCLEWWKAGYTESGLYTVCEYTISNETLIMKLYRVSKKRGLFFLKLVKLFYLSSNLSKILHG